MSEQEQIGEQLEQALSKLPQDEIGNTQRLATVFITSGLFKDVGQVAAAMVKVMMGRELGVPPVRAMMGINIIQGKIEASATLLASLVKGSGRYDYRVIESTNERCVIQYLQRMPRLGGQGPWEPIGESEFVMEDAKRAGLVKQGSNWEKWPRAMLYARAMSQGVRQHCPDAIGGAPVYAEGEIEELPPGPDPEPIEVPRADATIAAFDSAAPVGVAVGSSAQTLPIQKPARSIEDVPLPEPGQLQITDDQRDDLIHSADRKGLDLGLWLAEHGIQGPLSEVPSERASELLKEIHALPDPAQESLPVDENGWAKDEPKAAAKEKKKAGAK